MRLRDLTTLDDFRRVVELEKLVWRYADGEDVVPVPILVVTVKRGGILIGGFDDRDEMVGFVYSLPAVTRGKPTQWSHMLGVLDGYRQSGLGLRLKIEQRARALERGVELIEWTFDPLQAVNAHLNFRKLGVVVEEYEENIYGDSSSPLHRGTPTDRLVAQWWIATPRVERRIQTSDPEIPSTTAAAARVNVTRLAGDWLECERFDLTRDDPRLELEIPMRFTEMQERAPGLARLWRTAAREMFTAYFRRRYRAVDFFLDREAGRGRYLLAAAEL